MNAEGFCNIRFATSGDQEACRFACIPSQEAFISEIVLARNIASHLNLSTGNQVDEKSQSAIGPPTITSILLESPVQTLLAFNLGLGRDMCPPDGLISNCGSGSRGGSTMEYGSPLS